MSSVGILYYQDNCKMMVPFYLISDEIHPRTHDHRRHTLRQAAPANLNSNLRPHKQLKSCRVVGYKLFTLVVISSRGGD